MSDKTVLIRTDADGDFTYVGDLFAAVKAIAIDVGDLSTPDITIEDAASGATLLALTGMASSAYHVLAVEADDSTGAAETGAFVAPVCFGRLEVTVTGGGDTKTGSIRFLLES
jgi:predicted RNA methylase